jgi:hypothetical protein
MVRTEETEQIERRSVIWFGRRKWTIFTCLYGLYYTTFLPFSVLVTIAARANGLDKNENVSILVNSTEQQILKPTSTTALSGMQRQGAFSFSQFDWFRKISSKGAKNG